LAYPLLRSALFRLDAEASHELALKLIAHLGPTPLGGLLAARQRHSPVRAMGIDFPNPVGLAAGLDKNARAIDGLAALGFGFVEVGTVTPRAQPGNPRPRLFRLPGRDAIINRMGFNNDGVEALLARVRASDYRRRGGVLGINIGKNFDTPVQRANDDYLACLRAVYAEADYIAVNISSPNTAGLRDLQHGQMLESLFETLKNAQRELAEAQGRYVPLAVKIAPDLDQLAIDAIADSLRRYAIDAVIATNTTLSRDGVDGQPHAAEAGGLSGAPLSARALQLTRQLAAALKGDLPIIAAGGIMSAADAAARFDAGATLVQLYSGFIYHGPRLIGDIVASHARRGDQKPA